MSLKWHYGITDSYTLFTDLRLSASVFFAIQMQILSSLPKDKNETNCIHSTQKMIKEDTSCIRNLFLNNLCINIVLLETHTNRLTNRYNLSKLKNLYQSISTVFFAIQKYSLFIHCAYPLYIAVCENSYHWNFVYKKPGRFY